MNQDAELPPDAIDQSRVQRSSLEKFLDSFLHESSIKWMLVAGAAIVAASSLMLVTNHWSSWNASLKYLTILTYTAATYAVAEFCGKRLGLQSTSQVLRMLTVMLIPIGFLSLSWLTTDTASIDLANSSLTLLLMVPATLFMGYAADRIFKHWLQGRQTTFLAAYMLLCLAGAMPVVNQTWLAVLFSCGFWVVVTLGVLKVNRHLFWLAEEHRWPRIFGFFPIALLGTQLIVLLATKTIGAVPMHWLGLGVVMLAATILMTTRTIANVFRQRTGDLVRPLPMSLIAPLFTGVLLIAAGVLLSFHGFHFIGSSTRAVVPTALVAAALFGVIANDTRHRAFVWASLLLITIAYQSSPTLVGELVQSLKSTAAASLNESRLPIAFYGLTYLPLMLSFAVASRKLNDRQRFEFSEPLRQFATLLTMLLTLVSLTHIKAAAIVSTLSVLTFLLYAVLFRNRSYAGTAVACLVVATAAWVPFANAMQWIDGSPLWSLTAIAGLGYLLSSTSLWDRLVSSIPDAKTFRSDAATDENADETVASIKWCQWTGISLNVFAACAWLTAHTASVLQEHIVAHEFSLWVTFAIVFVSSLTQTMRSRHYGWGLCTWLLAAAGLWLWLATNAASVTVLGVGTISGVTGIAAYLLLRWKKINISLSRFSEIQSYEALRLPTRTAALALPLADVAMTHFIAIVVLHYLPAMVMATVTLKLTMIPAGWPIVFGLLAVAVLAFPGRFSTLVTALIAPIVAGVGVGQWLPDWFTYTNLPAIYAVASAVTMVALRNRIDRHDRAHTQNCSVWLYGLMVFSVVFQSPLVVAAALIAMATKYLLLTDRRDGMVIGRFAVVASVIAITNLAMVAGFRGFTAQLLFSPYFSTACVWMLLGIVICITIFDRARGVIDAQIAKRWAIALRGMALGLAPICLFASHPSGWVGMAVFAAMTLAIVNEFFAAISSQSETRVMVGFGLIGVLGFWVMSQHALPISPAVARLALVIGAALSLLLSIRWHEHPTRGIFVRSFRVFGLITPFVVSIGSLLHSNHNAVETLVVFGSAMILFLHGQTQRLTRYTVASAVLVNMGLIAFWNACGFSDPQFYFVPIGLTVIGLVELLRKEIPSKAHDPLRYAGALAILISPCFAIVGGSWYHMLSLMVLAVVTILLAIGLRLRVLIHTGVAFLFIDLAAMVIHSSIDNPGMLWITGLLLGGGVIAIAAICERNREQLLSRIRVLSAELSTWN